jgi:hypothetical protein
MDYPWEEAAGEITTDLSTGLPPGTTTAVKFVFSSIKNDGIGESGSSLSKSNSQRYRFTQERVTIGRPEDHRIEPYERDIYNKTIPILINNTPHNRAEAQCLAILTIIILRKISEPYRTEIAQCILNDDDELNIAESIIKEAMQSITADRKLFSALNTVCSDLGMDTEEFFRVSKQIV